MSIPSEIESALLDAESVNPNVFTYKGVDIPCSASSYYHSKTLEVGGFSVEADLSLTVRRDVIDAIPQEQEQIIFKGNNFKIDRVIEPSSGGFFRLICVSENRGV